MNRENLLFAIIGILFGFIVGFIFASNMSQRAAMNAPSAVTGKEDLPADHPPIQGGNNAQNPQQIFAQVQASMAKARNEPQNFDAQVEAAKLEYQIQRYDQAVEFLLKANQLKPDNYEVVVMLGAANLEGGHYDMAQKWYKIALGKKPDDVGVLASVAYLHLQKGDAKEAEKAIENLEKVEPTNQDLPNFKQRLASMKSGEAPK
ncbi:MAG TPA: tetratricopeptide repeat protein [Pyrinomonadaceae bacterium]|nr:tetratricopeptide repeat protein [Pyrinomonadaceae bacterium]